MMHQTLDYAGQGLGFEYELTYWKNVDEGFDSRYGAVPYSSKLHGIIEGLVKKGCISRNLMNPIELEFSSQQVNYES